MDGVSSMQIKTISKLKISNLGVSFETSDQRVKTANVLLAFREAILVRFSNDAFLAVLTASPLLPLVRAIEWGKEYRSS